jgi:hypothetical protein
MFFERSAVSNKFANLIQVLPTSPDAETLKPDYQIPKLNC